MLAALLTLGSLTACKEEQSAAPAAAPAGGSNADLFRPVDQAAQPAARPMAPPAGDDEGSGGPGASAGAPPLIPVLDPAVQKECETLKKREKELRDSSDAYRNEKVAPASSEMETAYDAFSECQLNYACTNNEGTYARLNAAVGRAESNLEKMEGELMKMEGELHDVSQDIARKCGDF